MGRHTSVLTPSRGKDEVGARVETGSILSCPVFFPRYPRVMVEEGLRAVRQWLEASSQLEEGEVSRGWRAGAGRRVC